MSLVINFNKVTYVTYCKTKTYNVSMLKLYRYTSNMYDNYHSETIVTINISSEIIKKIIATTINSLNLKLNYRTNENGKNY